MKSIVINGIGRQTRNTLAISRIIRALVNIHYIRPQKVRWPIPSKRVIFQKPNAENKEDELGTNL